MAVLPRSYQPLENTAYCNASNIPEILGVTGSLMGAAVVAVILRLFVRMKILKFVGADDYFMLAATVMAIATFVCFCFETQAGVGRHLTCIDAPDNETVQHWQFYHSLWVMFGVVFVKISIAFFLMRLATKKAWKRFLWGAIVFLTCFGLACAGTLIFSCVPVSASWTHAPHAKCFTNSTFAGIGLFNSIVNIFTDFLFALLPIPIIVKLQVNTRTKITLAMILSLGFVACAASIVKAHLQTTFLEDPDRLWQDGFNVWNLIELCLGILAASLPALKPLFVSMLASTKTALGTSGGQSRNQAASCGGAYPGISRSSGYKKHYDPRSIHEILADGDLKDYKPTASVVATSHEDTDPVEMTALAGVKRGYNVRVTSRDVGMDDRSWEDGPDINRSDSEERLHPAGIYRTMEISRTSEVMR